MSLGTAQLSESLQTLVDARLDTIDRMLLGRVPRQDRLSIVREVESQVFELLHERDGDDLTREDVLAVLARLDPPEAYLPEDDDHGPARSAAAPRGSLPVGTARKKAKIARASAILGLSALGMLLLSPALYLLVAIPQSEVLMIVFLFGAVVLTFSTSLLAIVFGIIGRRSGAWAIVGLVTGGLSILFGGLGGILLVLIG